MAKHMAQKNEECRNSSDLEDKNLDMTGKCSFPFGVSQFARNWDDMSDVWYEAGWSLEDNL